MFNDIIIATLRALEEDSNWTCEVQEMESRPAPETKYLARDYQQEQKERQIARRSERRSVRAAKRELLG